MLFCRNAEGVHGRRKVGNPWRSEYHFPKHVSIDISRAMFSYEKTLSLLKTMVS